MKTFHAVLALLMFASPAAFATAPPRPGENQRFPPFTLEGPGEHVLFSSMLVITGPFFFTAMSSEASSNAGSSDQRIREDAASFVASEGAYRSAALEAALRDCRLRAGYPAPDDLYLATELLVRGTP